MQRDDNRTHGPCGQVELIKKQLINYNTGYFNIYHTGLLPCRFSSFTLAGPCLHLTNIFTISVSSCSVATINGVGYNGSSTSLSFLLQSLFLTNFFTFWCSPSLIHSNNSTACSLICGLLFIIALISGLIVWRSNANCVCFSKWLAFSPFLVLFVDLLDFGRVPPLDADGILPFSFCLKNRRFQINFFFN